MLSVCLLVATVLLLNVIVVLGSVWGVLFEVQLWFSIECVNSFCWPIRLPGVNSASLFRVPVSACQFMC